MKFNAGKYGMSEIHHGFYAGGRTALTATTESGEPLMTITLNLDDAPRPGTLHVKMYGGHEKYRDGLLATGAFEDTGERVPCGHAEAEVWKFDREKLGMPSEEEWMAEWKRLYE